MTTPTPEEYTALVKRIEAALNETPQFSDKQVEILLSVVEAHVWRAGLWTRIRWMANVIGLAVANRTNTDTLRSRAVLATRTRLLTEASSKMSR